MFFGKLKISVAQARGKIGQLKRNSHFRIDPVNRRIDFPRPISGALKAKLHLDCTNIAFRATLNFRRLLDLADKADLDKLDQFATIDLSATDKPTGTEIIARGLKTFVRRELQGEPAKDSSETLPAVAEPSSSSGICLAALQSPMPAAAIQRLRKSPRC